MAIAVMDVRNRNSVCMGSLIEKRIVSMVISAIRTPMKKKE